MFSNANINVRTKIVLLNEYNKLRTQSIMLSSVLALILLFVNICGNWEHPLIIHIISCVLLFGYFFGLLYFMQGQYYHHPQGCIKWVASLINMNSLLGPQMFVMSSWLDVSGELGALMSYTLQMMTIVFTMWGIALKSRENTLALEWKESHALIFPSIEDDVPTSIV